MAYERHGRAASVVGQCKGRERGWIGGVHSSSTCLFILPFTHSLTPSTRFLANTTVRTREAEQEKCLVVGQAMKAPGLQLRWKADEEEEEEESLPLLPSNQANRWVVMGQLPSTAKGEEHEEEEVCLIHFQGPKSKQLIMPFQAFWTAGEEAGERGVGGVNGTTFLFPWTAESYSTGHWMEMVKQVPIRGSQLVHLHHVCVEGGEKGLALPHLRSYEELGASLKTYQPGSHKPAAFRVMDPREMATTIFPPASTVRASGATHVCMNVCILVGNQSVGSCGLTAFIHSLRPQVHGPTFFVNCWNRAPDDTNPSHWLMRIIKLYEIAEVVRSSEEGVAPALPLFEHLAFHQCPSYSSMIKGGAWPWAGLVMDAATHNWAKAGLWQGPDEIDVVELNKGDRNWTCFDDLYFETGHNSWYPAPQYQSSWLRTLHGMAEASLPSASLPALAPPQDPLPPVASLAKRCRTGNLRIHLFQRSTGSTLRSFANLEPVRALLQNFTSVPVPVVTVNVSTPLAGQIDAFRAFDVLVTSHGSQLGNIIFSDPGTSAIIEVLPVVRDLCFSKSAADASFASYVVSTGHTPVAIPDHKNAVCDEGRKTMDEHCKYTSKSDLWTCPEPLNGHLTACDTLVDLTVLERHLNVAISSLCDHKGETP